MTYGPLIETDEPAVFDIFSTAFAFPIEKVAPWVETAGRENVMVLRERSKPAACLIEIPMGHFWLGRSVPTIGIAGVGVALEERGGGAARRLMEQAIRSIAERKIPFSSLYPATQTLYRAVGYERAGKTLEVKVPTLGLDLGKTRETSVEMRRLTDADEPAVAELYAELAREQHGYLDRGSYMWSRVRKMRGVALPGIGFFADGSLEGYVYMRTETTAEQHAPFHDVVLTDLVASTPRAMRRILRFFYDQRSLAEHVTFKTGPEMPILSLLPENRYDQSVVLDWMVRITNLESALALRGYPVAVKTTLEIDVRDALVEANAGKWIVHVEDGKAQLARGGSGRIALDVRALASLYTGFLSATSMRRLGWLEAADAETRALDEVFRSPLPGMCEMF